MTEFEIRSKIDEYKSSDAPIEVKEEAISKLEAKLAASSDVALTQFMESQADLSDIQGHN